MTITFQKVAVNTMRSIVAEAIRNAIMEGGLRPSERIVERKLAAQFEASLSVIREALVELETEGFIVKRRNTATYVTEVTVEDAGKVFELRSILEPFATSLAAQRATEADISELRQIYTRMCERAAANDFRGYLREDYAWHDRVWQIADNEYVRTSLARALVPFYAFFAIRCQDPAFDLVADANAHLRILDALASHDAAAAEAHVREAMSEWRDRPAVYAAPAPASSDAGDTV